MSASYALLQSNFNPKDPNFLSSFFNQDSAKFVELYDMKYHFPFFSCCSSSSSTTAVINSPHGQNHDNFRVFSYNELKHATHNFHSSNKVGEGGFGSVYKGRLKDGSIVAVKVLSIEIETMRGEKEFVAELAALSNIKHENLVSLKGCCVDGTNRYLVYDYMENNSLSHTLLGGKENRAKFNWEARRDISIGVARGIAYLHEEVEPHIVHRDIKGSNILLDQNLRPKVADFGLSKLLQEDSSYVSTRVAGTLGYLAPEYAVSGRLTRKSDVYGFGVLLLEIVSGRAVIDFDMEHGEHYIVEKAWDAFKDNDIARLVDPVLGKDFPNYEAVQFLKIGLLCVQENTKQRPRMSTVLKMLTNKSKVNDDRISKPGLVTDFMDIKFGQKHSTQSVLFSKASTSDSMQSLNDTKSF